LKLFKELGCATASADEIVHTLYANDAFVGKLQKKFPSVVTDEAVNKSMIIDLMTADKKFRRSFQTFVWAEVKDWINGFIIKNSNKVTVVEVPLLFDAKMEKEFTYLVGVETDKQIEYLTKRHDSNIEGRLRFNAVNSYDANRKKLNFIIVNNAGRDELIRQVKDIYSKLNQE
jgi:dephospho-CoA kinase